MIVQIALRCIYGKYFGNFIVKIGKRSVDICMLIDTGASRTIIDSGFLAKSQFDMARFSRNAIVIQTVSKPVKESLIAPIELFAFTETHLAKIGTLNLTTAYT